MKVLKKASIVTSAKDTAHTKTERSILEMIRVRTPSLLLTPSASFSRATALRISNARKTLSRARIFGRWRAFHAAWGRGGVSRRTSTVIHSFRPLFPSWIFYLTLRSFIKLLFGRNHFGDWPSALYGYCLQRFKTGKHSARRWGPCQAYRFRFVEGACWRWFNAHFLWHRRIHVSFTYYLAPLGVLGHCYSCSSFLLKGSRNSSKTGPRQGCWLVEPWYPSLWHALWRSKLCFLLFKKRVFGGGSGSDNLHETGPLSYCINHILWMWCWSCFRDFVVPISTPQKSFIIDSSPFRATRSGTAEASKLLVVHWKRSCGMSGKGFLNALLFIEFRHL